MSPGWRLCLQLFRIVLPAIALTLPVLAQRADISAVAGGGFAGGEEQNTHGVSALGATVGFPYNGPHRLQFDYLFNNVYSSGSEKRHFLTGSYVLQGASGRARPYLQIGAGLVHRTFRSPGFLSSADTSFAFMVGGGATINVGQAFFIRPQVRVYAHVGPTFTVLACVGAGFRF